MKPQYLEALLIDRSLGELSPEVDALLGEWLEAHPHEVERLHALSRVVELARTAAAIEEGPPPPAETGWAELRRRRLLENLRGALPWLVGAAAGFVVAWMVMGRSVPRRLAATAEVVHAEAGDDRRIWSMRRVIEDHRASVAEESGARARDAERFRLWRIPKTLSKQ